MNPVIYELAKKADPEFHNDFDDMPDAIIGDEKIELFAKLIIEECINIVKPTSYHVEYPSVFIGGEEGVELLEATAEGIKTYFGIK